MAKTKFQGLICERFERKGALNKKKSRTKPLLNPKHESQKAKTRVLDSGFYIRKGQGLKHKIKSLFVNIFEL